MKVEMYRIEPDFHFKAVGVSGVPVDIDAAQGIGGQNAGARPMELLLMGVGSCSAIDVILILKKQKQQLNDMRLIIEADRVEDQIPSVFKKINLHFILSGKLSQQKVARAISLSLEKYCSAAAILSKTAKINHSFEIIAQ